MVSVIEILLCCMDHEIEKVGKEVE
jgi:hypothetical protein